MKLELKRRHLESGAAVNWIQAGHRRTAIEYAIAGTRLVHQQNVAQFPDDALFAELESVMPEWVVETIAQGAYIREYHLWEKDVLEYFGRHIKNSGAALTLLKPRKLEGNFVGMVQRLLADFALPDMQNEISALDVMRKRVNAAKHDPGLLLGHFVTIDEYWSKLEAIEEFWETVAGHEKLVL